MCPNFTDFCVRDVARGYRIRALGDAEKQAVVSQMVARQREWEDGLVSVYKRFLEICEKEVVSGGVLAAVGLKCLCQLLSEKTHFNFSQNIMEVVVRKFGRKEWDDQSDACVDCIRKVLENDKSGIDSLNVVRFVGRIIKSREFSVHPQVLECLLSLRLKDEISSGIRASTDKVHRTEGQFKSSGVGGGKLPWKDRKKGKTKPVVLSKKAKKAMKDRVGIEKEIQEAEETVRVEDRERNQTETLKLLFALYFRIIKLPHRSILFPAALDGLAKFAHLVNIDFFRDLMSVLRQHIEGNFFVTTAQEEEELATPSSTRHRTREALSDKLVCIVTAFELLSGQGEALNVDLTGFINDLYVLIVPLSSQLTIEDPPLHHRHTQKGSMIDLLLRALHLAFLQPRNTIPPIRAQAFAKRLLTICLSLPPNSVLKILGFVTKLLHRQPVIQSLFEIDEEKKGGGGLFRQEIEDVGLCCAQSASAWEVWVLLEHWDLRVREGVEELLRCVRELLG